MVPDKNARCAILSCLGAAVLATFVFPHMSGLPSDGNMFTTHSSVVSDTVFTP